MFHGTPVLGKDKPRWAISNLAETKSHAGDTLADIPRRMGERLFMSSDEEAYWRGWGITPLHGGLGRRYRDSRFDRLDRATRPAHRSDALDGEQ